MHRSKTKKLILAFLAFTMCLAAAYDQTRQARAQSEEYLFRRSWGGEAGELRNPWGVAVTEDGSIIVANTGMERVEIIDPGEKTVRALGYSGGANMYNNPVDAVVDDDGMIYVLEPWDFEVHKYDAAGKYLFTWWSPSDPWQFEYAMGLATDGHGLIYVATTTRIIKFSSQGQFLTAWGSRGSGQGQFEETESIAVDRNGDVYAADTKNHRIQKFTANGEFITAWGKEGQANGQFKSPGGIAVDKSGNILVADSDNARIQKFTNKGVYIQQWGSAGSGPGQFSDPHKMSIDAKGNIYVADSGNNRIQKFSPEGKFQYQWVTDNEFGQFENPSRIAVNSDGEIYVTDQGNHRIQRFTSAGTFINAWGGEGTSAGRFASPGDLDFDSKGNIYVADTGNDRVQKFTEDGEYLGQWGSPGSASGQFNEPIELAIDPNDFVYVVDKENDDSHYCRVQKFSPEGAYIAQWETGMQYVEGIAVDGDGNVYVSEELGWLKVFTSEGALIDEWGLQNETASIDIDADGNLFTASWWNTSVEKYSPTGSLLTSFGSRGYQAGQFVTPSGIAVDDDGNVIVSDVIHQRIQIFSPNLPAPDPYSGLVLDGAFEKTPIFNDWTYSDRLPVTRSAYSLQGNYSMLLGEVADAMEQGTERAWAYTTFFVRPEWDRPVLSFKYNIFANDILDYSDFLVEIQDGAGLNHLATVVRDGYQPCQPGLAPAAGTNLGWRTATADLSAYKGQHVRLKFSNRNLWPMSWGIWTYVDDVRVIDAGPLPQVNVSATTYLPVVTNLSCDPVPAAQKAEQAYFIRPAVAP